MALHRDSRIFSEDFCLYSEWAKWCWQRPPIIGLPLILLCLPLALLDLPFYAIRFLLYLVITWGKKFDETPKV